MQKAHRIRSTCLGMSHLILLLLLLLTQFQQLQLLGSCTRFGVAFILSCMPFRWNYVLQPNRLLPCCIQVNRLAGIASCVHCLLPPTWVPIEMAPPAMSPTAARGESLHPLLRPHQRRPTSAFRHPCSPNSSECRHVAGRIATGASPSCLGLISGMFCRARRRRESQLASSESIWSPGYDNAPG